jgi:hypothetical protein
MTADQFYEEGSRVLTPEAFDFVFNNELRRALRSQNFLTLVTLAAHPEPEPSSTRGAAASDPVAEVVPLISRDVRETDLLAQTEPGTLSLVLLDADLDSSLRVIDRVMARLDHYEFGTPLSIAVGAACCPTHAVDAEALRHHAVTQPLLNRRRGKATGHLSAVRDPGTHGGS